MKQKNIYVKTISDEARLAASSDKMSGTSGKLP